MHILVIGGAGYIGSHVVKYLAEQGEKITVFDNLSTGNKESVDGKAKFVLGDILDKEKLDEEMAKDVDGVILLAGKKAVGESMENPSKYAVNNITGVINVLNSMIKNNVKKLIFSSSAAVYGMPQYFPADENHPLNPINFYGFTKLEAERLFEWYDKLKGLKFVALRYFNAVGYDEDGKITALEKNPQDLLPIVMEAAVGKRDKISIFGDDYPTPDGTCIRDYIHVSDLASAHYMALNYLTTHDESQIINLGTAKGSSVLEVIQRTEEIIGKKLPYSFAARRPGDPAILTANPQKAYELLGWKATHSSLDNIISSTWSVYKKHLIDEI